MSEYSASISKYGPKGKEKYRVFYSYICPVDGLKHRTCKRGFKLEREAKSWVKNDLPNIINQLEHVETLDENLTMGELVEKYKQHISLRLKPTTVATKEHIIDKKILPFFKDKVVYKISVKDIESWHDKLLTEESKSGKKYSETYLRTINNQLSAILNYAVRKHGLQDNPMSKAELIGSKDGEEREFWEVDEYLKFRDAISDKPIFYYAFEVLFWCGLRLGEMQALTAEDLDLEAKTLRVDESYARLKKKDIIGAPKTKAGKRTIAIHDDLAMELKEYLECLGPIDPKARIFPVSKSGMYHEMKRGCKLSGVKKITIHGLRHSHISMLMEIGVPAVAIAPRVGQKRTSMTMHYGHPYEKRAREIANNINEMAGKQDV